MWLQNHDTNTCISRIIWLCGLWTLYLMTLGQGPGHRQPCTTLCTVVSVPFCTWQDTVLETVYWHQFLKWNIGFSVFKRCMEEMVLYFGANRSDVKRWNIKSADVQSYYLRHRFLHKQWKGLQSAHVLTWAGDGSRYLAGQRCRSVPIWYAAAARWFLGSDKQNLFPAKDRLDSSTCTRHRGTTDPSSTIYPGQIRRYQRISTKSSNGTPSLTDLRCL